MSLTPETFDAIRKVVHDLCGIVIGADKQYLVIARLGPLLQQNQIPSYESLLERLRLPNSLPLQEAIIEAITTRETSFNRDSHPFEELRRSILPELANQLLERRATGLLLNPKARIWCTAVATGQEAYSVAMAVSEFLASRPGLGLTLDDFPILATDICQNALQTAREGRYTRAELDRGISPELRTKYFREASGGGWLIAEPLRRIIEFRRVNLVKPFPNLGTFDLILCRNFLIYLDEAARRALCRGLHQSLNPGGILMIGAAESIYGLTDTFSTERLGNTFIHRKR